MDHTKIDRRTIDQNESSMLEGETRRATLIVQCFKMGMLITVHDPETDVELFVGQVEDRGPGIRISDMGGGTHKSVCSDDFYNTMFCMFMMTVLGQIVEVFMSRGVGSLGIFDFQYPVHMLDAYDPDNLDNIAVDEDILNLPTVVDSDDEPFISLN